jgi:hypothetical protein
VRRLAAALEGRAKAPHSTANCSSVASRVHASADAAYDNRTRVDNPADGPALVLVIIVSFDLELN